MRCPHGFALGLGLCEECEPPRKGQARPRPLRKCHYCKREMPRDKLSEDQRHCKVQPCHETRYREAAR